MPRIAVFGGTGYLASLIKHQNNIKKNRYIFFSRKKSDINYINYSQIKKNIDILKDYDVIIHLVGPKNNQIKNDKNLIKKKISITSSICDLCISNGIKLIYLSSMQVYRDYGIRNINLKSKINKKNIYSLSHYESENVIKKKFLNQKKMFIILRMGNVFGLKTEFNLSSIKDNLIHSFCFLALKKKKIFIKNAYIQRTFIPSIIFIQIINLIIKKNFFKNKIINISYKNLSLKDVVMIIKKRIKFLFKIQIDLILKKIDNKKKFSVHSNNNFKLNVCNQKIYQEIDQILRFIKKNLKYSGK